MIERSESDRWAALARESKREARRTRQMADSYQREAVALRGLLSRHASQEEVLDCLEREAAERSAVGGTPRLRALIPPETGGVYAFQAGRFVKIGRSNNIAKRLAALQTSHPQVMKLVAVLSPDTDQETAFHKQFASCRAYGEWFYLRGSLLNAVRSIQWEQQ
jgi:hypothetical protein